MTREPLLPESMDLIYESEESDQEYILNSRSPFEDLCNEIDISLCYRRMNSDNMYELRSCSSRRRKTSKSVQTDPDVSNIPPSWLLHGEKLVDELYTGLGNIINAVHHNPESHTDQFNGDSGRMKYFTYENGYWQSTLLPNIKIPGRLETYGQNKALCSDTTKKHLHHLFEVATKLRTVIPYIANLESYKDQQISEDKDKFSPYDQSTPKTKRSISPCQCDGILDENMDLTNVSVDTRSDSGKSSKCSPEYCDVEKHITKRMKNAHDLESLNRRNEKSYDSSGLNQITGVEVSRYTYNKQTSSSVCSQMSKPEVSHIPKSRKRNVKAEYTKSLPSAEKSTSVISTTSTKILASCSKDFKFANRGKVQSDHGDPVAKPSREKRSLFDQENKNKPQLGTSQKDFIRKNIMALKNHVSRVGSSAVRNDRNYNAETRGTSQSRNRRIDFAYPEEIRK